MGQQRLNQKKTTPPTRPHPTKTSVKSPVHPVEEVQAAIGNREMGRLMETNRLPYPSSPFPKLQGELPLLGGMPVSQGTIQRQPLFRGLSQELNAEKGTLVLPETGAVVQRKLTLGTPNDMYEQEADRVARQVVDEIHTSPFREPNPQPEEERKPEVGEAGRVQRQITVRASGDAGGELSSEWEGELQRAKSGGQPLSPSVKEPMERAFGADFGGVRLHTGEQADRLARTIQAYAFTTGQDVFFRQGAYEPGSPGGQELIAHELTHVVQQGRKALKNSEGNNIQRVIKIGEGRSGQTEEYRQEEQLSPLFNRDPEATEGIDSMLKAMVRDTIVYYFATWGEAILELRQQVVRKVEQPERIGKEIELPSITLNLSNQHPSLRNGIELARSVGTELGIPVIKLETEGADRGGTSLTIEIIIGPLPPKEYQTEGYKQAIRQLLETMNSGQETLTNRVNNYNTRLSDTSPTYRYRLQINNNEGIVNEQWKGRETKRNVQTNLSIDYSSLSQKGTIEKLIAKSDINFSNIWNKARNLVNSRKLFPWANVEIDAQLKSLLLQIITQLTLYADNSIEVGKEKPKDKHVFHLLVKASVEDVVMSGLNDQAFLQLMIYVFLDPSEGFSEKMLRAVKETSAKSGMWRTTPPPAK